MGRVISTRPDAAEKDVLKKNKERRLAGCLLASNQPPPTTEQERKYQRSQDTRRRLIPCSDGIQLNSHLIPAASCSRIVLTNTTVILPYRPRNLIDKQALHDLERAHLLSHAGLAIVRTLPPSQTAPAPARAALLGSRNGGGAQVRHD